MLCGILFCGGSMTDIFEKEIDGTVYRARFNGMAFALDLMAQDEENTSQIEVAEILFNEVLVSPKVSIDDFSDIHSFLRVQSFLYNVACGNFPAKKLSTAQLKRKVKDNWNLWRLVLCDRGFDYQTVFGKTRMSPQDIKEANIAYDMQLEAERKAAKAKK